MTSEQFYADAVLEYTETIERLQRLPHGFPRSRRVVLDAAAEWRQLIPSFQPVKGMP